MLKEFLTIGTLAMLLLGVLRRKTYQFAIWKMVLATLSLTAFGVLGVLILFYLENGWWGGQSYFGAVLITPVLMLIVAVLLRIPYGKLLDYCAPAECVMLAIMKIDCVIYDCCGGRVLFYKQNGLPVYFPSQIAECMNALVVLFILLRLEKNPKNRNLIYPYYLIIYGITRFILNCFRRDLKPFVWILSPGHFWALISVVIGTLIVWIMRKKHVVVNSNDIS